VYCVAVDMCIDVDVVIINGGSDYVRICDDVDAVVV